jgi:8-oxo-dGTP pyrophosphatase MutT (NUDIX family)
LYTRRSAQLRKHRSEVSFPGGKSDPGDKDAIDTALRETQEELGISRTNVDIWGASKQVSDSKGEIKTP